VYIELVDRIDRPRVTNNIDETVSGEFVLIDLKLLIISQLMLLILLIFVNIIFKYKWAI
jgi:hypothetical protein